MNPKNIANSIGKLHHPKTGQIAIVILKYILIYVIKLIKPANAPN